MSAISPVSVDWLELRCEADAAARSRTLAADIARRIGPAPLLIHDLGSGTGAMMRWLAPQLPGPQSWVLHDGDPGVLALHGRVPAVDGAGERVAVRTSVEPLAELEVDAVRGASLVVASALFDVLTDDEVITVVTACVTAGAPVFFSLTVTGRVRLEPGDPLDASFQAAFNDHQRRIAMGRPLLGPDATAVVERLFGAAGWRVRVASSPWRLGAGDRGVSTAWLDGWVGAAVEQRPELAAEADAYLRSRRTQLAAGGLRVEVEHEDLIAWRP